MSSAVAVFDRDTTTGALIQKADPDGCITNFATAGCTTGKALGFAISVTVSPDGKSAYVASQSSNAVAVFDRVPAPLTNTSPISIPAVLDGTGVATPFPSTITVSGEDAKLSDVNVTLHGLSHTRPDDLDIVLFSPAGTYTILTSDAGGSTDIAAVDLTFDDQAAGQLADGDPISTGTYRPTNFGAPDDFTSPPTCNPGPEGASPAADCLATAFNGTDPNGTWSLFVADDAALDNGRLAYGWSLELTTDVVAPAAPVITATDPASPSNSSTTPKIKGTTDGSASKATVYEGAGCSGASVQTTATTFEGAGIPLSVGANATTQISAELTDLAGNTSPCSSPIDYTHDSVAPAAPVITATDPASPSNSSTNPKVKGTTDGSAQWATVYEGAGCSGASVQTTATTFEGAGIPLSVGANATTQISAELTDLAGNTSPCSSPIDYTHDSVAPAAPVITATDPASPSNSSTNPKVKGTTDGSAQWATVYEGAGCSGASVQTTATTFEGAGIPLSVGANATTQISAELTDLAGNTSPCSSPIDYTHDSVAPAAPVITATDPASPSNDNTPSITGTAETGSTVNLYSTNDCTGPAAATGTAADFAAAGLGVTVADDSTSTFHATATDGAGNTSACSSESIVYADDSTPPDTTIDSGPTGTIATDQAAFTFSGDPASDTNKIQCRIDSEPFADWHQPRRPSPA